MTKNLEEKTKEICPFADECATEYGADLVCQDENSYEDCVIYKELIKHKGKK